MSIAAKFKVYAPEQHLSPLVDKDEGECRGVTLVVSSIKSLRGGLVLNISGTILGCNHHIFTKSLDSKTHGTYEVKQTTFISTEHTKNIVDYLNSDATGSPESNIHTLVNDILITTLTKTENNGLEIQLTQVFHSVAYDPYWSGCPFVSAITLNEAERSDFTDFLKAGLCL